MTGRAQTRLLIAGGGTGGHLFPGVAVVEALQELETDAEVLFVGTERGIEARIVPELGYELKLIEVSGLKTVGILGAIKGALRIPGALWQSRKLLKNWKPTAVIGVGGYASGPVVLAARLMGIPTAILEQNSIPGLTNRILGKFAKKVFLSFAHSASFFSAKKSELVGNPVRRDILAALRSSNPKTENTNAGLRVFVFGGSQGAVAVNQMMAAAAGTLAKEGIPLSIVHQVGRGRVDQCVAEYKEHGGQADCREFIGDMASEYLRAELIVCRAGATSIAELAVVGKPAILIPYPSAANNHQVLNGAEMAKEGAALMIEQSGDAHNDAIAMSDALRELASDETKRARMAAAMKKLGRGNAAEVVARWARDAGC